LRIKKRHRGKGIKNKKNTSRVIYKNEKMTVDALDPDHPDVPLWIENVRLSTKHEDFERAVDVVVVTDIGDFYIQVKSRESGIDKFHRRLLKLQEDGVVSTEQSFYYICVVVRSDDSHKRIRRIVLSALEEKRTYLIKID
jgi:hypothetical protein